MFIFNLNVVFTTDFLKMAPIRVRFSPGFPPGAGFHGEEFCPSLTWSHPDHGLSPSRICNLVIVAN
jgi:hypothetical protein